MLGRVGAMVFICFLTRLFELDRQSLVALPGQPRGREITTG
jgi:hypothetical protein